MPNYKCIKEFKSFHGKYFRVDEIIGAKYVNVMKEEEKANFVHFNNYPDVALTVGLGSLDKHRTRENLGFNKKGGYIRSDIEKATAKASKTDKKKVPGRKIPDTPVTRADVAIDTGLTKYEEKITVNPASDLSNLIG